MVLINLFRKKKNKIPLNVFKFISGYYQNKISIIKKIDEEIPETYASRKLN